MAFRLLSLDTELIVEFQVLPSQYHFVISSGSCQFPLALSLSLTKMVFCFFLVELSNKCYYYICVCVFADGFDCEAEESIYCRVQRCLGGKGQQLKFRHQIGCSSKGTHQSGCKWVWLKPWPIEPIYWSIVTI